LPNATPSATNMQIMTIIAAIIIRRRFNFDCNSSSVDEYGRRQFEHRYMGVGGKQKAHTIPIGKKIIQPVMISINDR
jgi:hypothetical protein